MSDRYLWDRSGEPDPDVVRLERLLGQLRRAPGRASILDLEKRRRRRQQAAVAAAILLIGAGVAIAVKTALPGATSWELSFRGKQPTRVRAGQTIETSSTNRATLKSESVGTVEIGPESHLRVLSARDDEQRFALDRGVIHALIWAPPTRFAVDTPWAKTIDLGCQYTLRVDKEGAGLLSVETGWVAFQWRKQESFIPAGAACATRPGSGPGTPYFLNATVELTADLAAFDRTGNGRALSSVLAAARPRDALTLWHLLRRTEGPQRAEVFDRFEKLVALPVAASRAAILRGDQGAMDAAWNALNLGDTSWWREWKREW
jgi:hypothetical protein